MKIELSNNLLQLFAALLGLCLSGLRCRGSRRQAYFLLLCFYGCFALGSLYWTLYLLLFSTTPRVFYVSEFGWISGTVFLHILQYTLASDRERAFRCAAGWLSPIVGIPLLILYCLHGDILLNLIWCSLIMILSYGSIKGLVYAKRQTGVERNMVYFHAGVLCFAVAEYLLWASGCFWSGDTLANPCFWFDALLTCSIVALLPATAKAVDQ